MAGLTDITDIRITFIRHDGAATIERQQPKTIDLIFADGEAGKHTLLDDALALLGPGGIPRVSQRSFPRGRSAATEPGKPLCHVAYWHQPDQPGRSDDVRCSG